MGTYYRVNLIANNPIDQKSLQASIENILEQVNTKMSTYRVDSEISRFNASKNMDWILVSEDLVKVSLKALEIYKQTAGGFDVSVSPWVDLWNFGPEHRSQNQPSESEIKKTAEFVGSDKFEVRRSPPALRKSVIGLRVDLSAIAKGFAVDKLARRLLARGYSDFLVDIGGELRSEGMNSNGQPWQVGIEKPVASLDTSIQQVVSLSGKSIATSGSYRNFFEKDGIRYSHIINPHTGYPITHKLISVTVIAPDCMSADAYATGLMVLGPDKGYDFALQYGLAVYMIEKKGDEIVVKSTPQMAMYME